MNGDQDKQNNLINTTDCLEAIGVFRGWKNFLFIIVIICLLLLQVSFWLVNTGWVKTRVAKSDSPAVTAEDTKQTEKTSTKLTEEKDKIKQAAKQVAAEPNQPTEATAEQPKKIIPDFNLTTKQLSWLVRFLNFVIIPTACLYCLTMLFSLKISLLGRLGGINHICRAFFLSLVFVILLLPWQLVFNGLVAGAIYSPKELLSCCAGAESRGIFGDILFYLRFTGYWLLALLLLIFSQLRSARWTKAILRRLEVI